MPLLTSPAAARNKGPILEVLRRVLPASGTVLELAEGSGEHVVFFAEHLPALLFVPSDADASARESIAERVRVSGLENVRAPLALDATAPAWPAAPSSVAAMVCINMVHIAPWAACLGLLRHAAALLPKGGPLVLYGPYVRDGVETARSNLAFDESLRARNPAWGVRKLEDVVAAAEGLALDEVVEMPANNLTVVYRRR